MPISFYCYGKDQPNLENFFTWLMVNGLGPWGAGYLLTLGGELKSETGRHRFMAMGHALWLPDDVL